MVLVGETQSRNRREGGRKKSVPAEERTPLHGILGCCELLLGGQAGPLSAEARRLITAIAGAARRLEGRLARPGRSGQSP